MKPVRLQHRHRPEQDGVQVVECVLQISNLTLRQQHRLDQLLPMTMAPTMSGTIPLVLCRPKTLLNSCSNNSSKNNPLFLHQAPPVLLHLQANITLHITSVNLRPLATNQQDGILPKGCFLAVNPRIELVVRRMAKINIVVDSDLFKPTE